MSGSIYLEFLWYLILATGLLCWLDKVLYKESRFLKNLFVGTVYAFFLTSLRRVGSSPWMHYPLMLLILFASNIFYRRIFKPFCIRKADTSEQDEGTD